MLERQIFENAPFAPKSSALATELQSIDESIDNTTASNTLSAFNIQHFFIKIEEQRFCKPCRTQVSANPDQFPRSRNYTYAASTTSGNLCALLNKYHKEEYLCMCLAMGWKNQLPSVTKAKNTAIVLAPKHDFNPGKAIDQLRLLCMFCDDFGETELPHCMALTRMILKTWLVWFDELKANLATSCSTLSYTADVWSDKSCQSFLCITVHWITKKTSNAGDDDGRLESKSSLLAFHPLASAHTSKNIAKVTWALLRRAGIEDWKKGAGFWMIDNASNNNLFMTELAAIYKQKCPDIEFNMFAENYAEDSGEEEEEEESNEEIDDDSNKDSNKDDEGGETSSGKKGSKLLRKVCKLVTSLRVSGQQVDTLNAMIVIGNEQGWWQHPDDHTKAVKVVACKLLLDVPTRWDSTFAMLQRLQELQQPVEKFLKLDPIGKQMQKHTLSKEQWEHVTNMIAVLQWPHWVQQVMSVDKNPVLTGAIPTIEQFMEGWTKLAQSKARLSHFAKKYYHKMDDTPAYVIVLWSQYMTWAWTVLHPFIRLSWIWEHWDPKWITQAEITIKDTMQKYCDDKDFLDLHTQPAGSPRKKKTTATSQGWLNLGLPSKLAMLQLLVDMAWEDTSSIEIASVEDEYHKYTFSMKSKPDVDLLHFWMSQKDEFPTLYAMALDFLPIQASSVPCERAFLSSGETDMSQCNQLSPALMA
ncbi:hypothetical protein DXG01_005186 [Tephrocybe rancida]|nr:hypothetical protein DXG01_005186 [Tephrocybe rancida]